MNTSEARLTTLDPAEISKELDRNGVAIIRNFVPAQELKRTQDTIKSIASANNGEYVFIEGTDGLDGTFLETWARDPAMLAFGRAVCEHALRRSLPSIAGRQTVRILCGESGQAESLIFHYDSYVLTALIPVIAPEAGSGGDFVIFANRRPLRRTYLRNLVDRIGLDNKIVQRSLRHRYADGAFVRVPLEPGSLCLFWGYRSVHTNDRFRPDQIRCTAILHFVDPHANSVFKRALRRSGRAKPPRSQPLSDKNHEQYHNLTR
ncbi:hypothetical protein L1787_17335 [Acuticoccus sp. M5D2P5]|uniref:hypothetical protein n=1 Tax=Acuticoccus kalidii TaxID=2910977 RepID=UPI001F199C29|nr:hypothetical protein [Acuticoccus kalidii]MCF3935164.1 hypothetical protein [Acuticoccus kalidii]